MEKTDVFVIFMHTDEPFLNTILCGSYYSAMVCFVFITIYAQVCGGKFIGGRYQKHYFQQQSDLRKPLQREL